MTQVFDAPDVILACPLCGGRDLAQLIAAHGFDAFTTLGDGVSFTIGAGCCTKCGFVFLSPRGSQSQMSRYYARQSRIPRKSDNLGAGFSSLLDLQVEFLLAGWTGPRASRVLDIGGAEGFFLDRLRQQLGGSVQCVLVEPSGKYADFAAGLIPDIEIHRCMLEEATLGGEQFDIVSMRHVLEHVQAPLDVLRVARGLLRPGGRLHLELPDAAIWPASVSSMFHHEHLNYFVQETLRFAMARAGLRVDRLESWTGNPANSGFSYPVLRCIASAADFGSGECESPDPIKIVDGIRAQIDSRNRFLSERIAPLRHRLVQLSSSGARLGLFGGGPHTLDLLSALDLPHSIWQVVLDNNPNKSGRSLKGIRIVPPSREELSRLDVVVISSEAFEAEMATQAEALGMPRAKIVTIYSSNDDCSSAAANRRTHA